MDTDKTLERHAKPNEKTDKSTDRNAHWNAATDADRHKDSDEDWMSGGLKCWQNADRKLYIKNCKWTEMLTKMQTQMETDRNTDMLKDWQKFRHIELLVRSSDRQKHTYTENQKELQTWRMQTTDM